MQQGLPETGFQQPEEALQEEGSRLHPRLPLLGALRQELVEGPEARPGFHALLPGRIRLR